MKFRVFSTFVFIVFSIVGCASIPKDYERTTSYAISQPTETTLWQILALNHTATDDQSGFEIIESGERAFRARLALLETAEQTIDLQYYHWHTDQSGRILAARLLNAADRGIRVRILVDGIQFDTSRRGALNLDAHPNIEIRLYNAFGGSFRNNMVRIFEMLFDFQRLNHRMHSKMFVVDNTVAISGGRNIGDAYFGLDDSIYFRDREVFSVGPIVPKFSEAFDTYWNSEFATPAYAFGQRYRGEVDIETARRNSTTLLAGLDDFPYDIDFERDWVLSQLNEIKDQLVWAPATLSYNPPGPIDFSDELETIQHVQVQMARYTDAAKFEILVQTPYLMLDKPREARLDYLPQREGLRVRVVTNSLASADGPVVHSGYSQFRKRLLQKGVELHELKPRLAEYPDRLPDERPQVRTIDHAKTTVFDREIIYIGSFNSDFRSIYLNSEIGLFIKSAELANRVAEAIERDMAPGNSWRLNLTETNSLEWIDVVDGEERRQTSEPGARFGSKFKRTIAGILPIDWLL